MDLKAKKGKRIAKMVCPACGQEFSFYKTKGNHKRIFCSEKCRNRTYQKRIKIAYQEWKNKYEKITTKTN